MTAGRVLLIVQMAQARDDRVSRWLAAAGYRLDWRFMSNGDTLPDPRDDYDAVVVYGGPQSANDDAATTPFIRDELDFIRAWSDRDKPFLGLCLGAQLLARAHGGAVRHHPEGLSEIGYYPLRPTAAGEGLMPPPMRAYHWHSEGFEVPPGGELLAEGETFPNQAFRLGRHAYGLQFHPETTVPIFRTWMAEAPQMLDAPGAQDRETQFRYALDHDAPLAAWLESFLPRWLGRDEG